MNRYYSGVQFELEFTNKLLEYQTKMLLWLVATFVLVGVVELVFPTFFDYPYLQTPTQASILAFWPLLLYGFTMASLSATGTISSEYDFELFSKGMLCSLLAGVWEELGYRCVFICTAMIVITWSNILWNGIFSILVAAAFIGGGFWMLKSIKNDYQGIKKIGISVFGIALIVLGIITTHLMFTKVNPAHIFYEYMVVPLIWAVTLGTFSNVLYSEESPRLFIYGAVLANAWFRDGHKYQGIVGIINSWIVGFVMLYAVLHYGLYTAIILHVTYDLFFDICHFTVRKFR